jgi:hypothetical protein
VLFALLFAAGARAQATPPYLSYAAKFSCGTEDPTEPDDVVTGTYATSINIHNPQAGVTVNFFKKIVVAQRERSDFVSPVILQDILGPDRADFVDCIFIRTVVPVALPYFEGFVVLQVPQDTTGVQTLLDVVAKYTARPSAGEVSTQDVIRITPQFITR